MRRILQREASTAAAESLPILFTQSLEFEMQKSVFLTLAGSAALFFAGCDSATTTKSDSEKPATTTPDATTPATGTSQTETSTDLGTPATPPEGGSAVKPGAELAPAAGTDAN